MNGYVEQKYKDQLVYKVFVDGKYRGQVMVNRKANPIDAARRCFGIKKQNVTADEGRRLVD